VVVNCHRYSKSDAKARRCVDEGRGQGSARVVKARHHAETKEDQEVGLRADRPPDRQREREHDSPGDGQADAVSPIVSESNQVFLCVANRGSVWMSRIPYSSPTCRRGCPAPATVISLETVDKMSFTGRISRQLPDNGANPLDEMARSGFAEYEATSANLGNRCSIP
jgi:hypothetical protein